MNKWIERYIIIGMPAFMLGVLILAIGLIVDHVLKTVSIETQIPVYVAFFGLCMTVTFCFSVLGIKSSL